MKLKKKYFKFVTIDDKDFRLIIDIQFYNNLSTPSQIKCLCFSFN